MLNVADSSFGIAVDEDCERSGGSSIASFKGKYLDERLARCVQGSKP